MDTERINRAVGFGYFQYVQEVLKPHKTTEKAKVVYIRNAIEMKDDALGQKINYLV